MPVLFAGRPIFGTCTRVDGPAKSYRAAESTLPGVNGARVYDLGDGTREWTVTGRLTATDKAAVRQAVAAAQACQTGGLYPFDSDQGQTYADCRLADFRLAGPMLRCVVNGVAAWTVEVAGVVRQVNPT